MATPSASLPPSSLATDPLHTRRTENCVMKLPSNDNEATSGASPIRRPSVLILDDDPTSLRVAYFSLRRHYEVFACETLQQAIAIVREEVIDYLISDFHLGYAKRGRKPLSASAKSRPLTLWPVSF